uniref:Peptidase S1 domain-containing protein n=1 Tax=Trichogramma kaykai TaxID=54128 RepID=A0ABD2WKR3_9HYME
MRQSPHKNFNLKGDSGGPVLDENNVQISIISFNLDCGGEAPVPSAVTDVGRIIRWILITAGIKKAYDGISD